MFFSKKGKYTINSLILLLFTINVSAQTEIVSGKIKTVCIDAGHGGRDPGAIGKNLKEKELTLAVALKLGKLINARFPDVEVIYTRTDDRFIELFQRADIANKANADLFISVHVNSSVKKEVNGVEFWVLGLHRAEENLEVAKKENAALQFEKDIRVNYGFDPNSPEGNIIMTMKQGLYLDKSIQFAKAIENKFTVDENQVVRGTKQAGFAVLYRTSMPSVLVEIGFVSNMDEEQYMGGEFGQQKIATKIVNAFADYKRNFENGSLNSKEAKAQVESVKNGSEKVVLQNNPNSRIQIEDEPELTQTSIQNPTNSASIPVSKIPIPSNPNSTTTTTAKITLPKQTIPSSTTIESKPEKQRIVIDEELDREIANTNSNPAIIKSNTDLTPTKPNAKTPIFEEPKSKLAPIKEVPKVKEIPKIAEVSKPKEIVKEVSKVAEVSKPKEIAKEIIKEKPITIPTPTTTSPPIVQSKTQVKEKIIDTKINDINTNEAKSNDPAVPTYMSDASVKKEILSNIKKIDKSFKAKEAEDINEPIEKNNTNNLAAVKHVVSASSGTIYRIQVKASGTVISGSDKIFSIGEEIEERKEDGLYKYLLGSFAEESVAHAYKDKIRAKGLSDAFVVKYSNGKRVK